MLKEQASPTSTSQRLKQKSSHLHRDGVPAFKRQAHRKSQAVPPALQKTFFGFIYIHAAILPSTGAHLPVTSGSTTPWTHPFALQGVSIRLLKEHSSIRQHKTKEINGGEEKKAYTPNPQSLHHKHSHCQHLKHHCHGNHGTFSPADRRAGKETLVSSLLAG